ncbi:MAG: hypothetical protein RID91_14000 [Azospirillaceae bacterium]
MLDRDTLTGRLDRLMQEEVSRFGAEVPNAGLLTDPAAPVDVAYYLRHRIETVHRIRLTAETDAKALSAMIPVNYEAARLWGRYTAEEMQHDRIFLRDLARHGLSDAQVLAVPPYASTRAMLAFLHRAIDEGGGLPAVAYSLFVEWNSERAGPAVADKIARQFGAGHVAGARAHLQLDDKEEHWTMMVDVARALLADERDAERLDDLIRAVAEHFRAYFRELHETTIGWRVAQAAPAAAE